MLGVREMVFLGYYNSVQEALETDKEYTGIEIFEMANKGNEKVIAGIDAFAKEVATKSLMYTLFLIVKKWLLVVVYLPNHYLLNSLIKI